MEESLKNIYDFFKEKNVDVCISCSYEKFLYPYIIKLTDYSCIPPLNIARSIRFEDLENVELIINLMLKDLEMERKKHMENGNDN